MHDLVFTRKQLGDLERRLAFVNKQIEDLPSLVFQKEDVKAEMENRRQRAQALDKVRHETEDAVKATRARVIVLEAQRDHYLKRGMRVELLEERADEGLNTWLAHFTKDGKGLELSYTATHKRNWLDFKIAMNDITKESYVRKISIPEEIANTPGYKEIGMRGVRVVRRFHGKGMFKYDPKHPDGDTGIYSGGWRHGRKHGLGSTVNPRGRFQGNFERDKRKGNGTMVYIHGDVYKGNFDQQAHHPRVSYLSGDEYMDGDMHGKGILAFVDGSVYEGEFKDGAPCGHGRYITVTGMKLEGEFNQWGLLHGEGSLLYEEISRIGVWRDGMMHGPGVEVDGFMGTYDGDFKSNMKNGFGEYKSKLANGTYDGLWYMNFRNNRGVFNFSAGKTSLLEEQGALPDPWEAQLEKTIDSSKFGEIPPIDKGAKRPVPQGQCCVNAVLEAAKGEVKHYHEAAKNIVGTGKIGFFGLGEGALGTAGAAKEKGKEKGDGKDKKDGPTISEVEDGLPRKPALGEVAEEAPGIYRRATAGGKHFIPYRGDYCYEGPWKAGHIRSGGIFTRRRGIADPVAHMRSFTTDSFNRSVPFLGVLQKKETEIASDRQMRHLLMQKSVLEQRQAKESNNIRKYGYWLADAEKHLQAIVQKNYDAQQKVRDVRGQLVSEQKARFGRVLFPPRPGDDDIKPPEPEESSGPTRTLAAALSQAAEEALQRTQTRTNTAIGATTAMEAAGTAATATAAANPAAGAVGSPTPVSPMAPEPVMATDPAVRTMTMAGDQALLGLMGGIPTPASPPGKGKGKK
jgi:hypothetical protein